MSIKTKLQNKNNYIQAFIFLGIVVFCILTSILIITDKNKPYYYNMLWLMPIVYMVCVLLLYKFYGYFKHISVVLITAIYGVRMLVLPFFMYLGEYMTYGRYEHLSKYMDYAIILMCYEAFFIFIFMIIRSTKLHEYKQFTINKRINISDMQNSFSFKIMIVILIMYMILIFIGTPGLIQESFFFTTGRSETSQEFYNLSQVSHYAFNLSFGGVLVSLLFTIFWNIQALLPPFLISNIITTYKKQNTRYLFFLIVVLFTLMICTETRAHSIECAMAVVITTLLFYKNEIKINYTLILGFVLIILITGLTNKSNISFDDTKFYNEISRMMAAYFSGPNNTATSIAAVNESQQLNILNIFSDLLLKIPYLNQGFKSIFNITDTSNIIFNTYAANESGKLLGQIIPSVGMGYAYFGFLLAPIVPCVAVYFAMKFDELSQSTSNIIWQNLFILFTIMMSRNTAMSNMLSGVWNLGNFFISWIILKTTIFFGQKKPNSVMYNRVKYH